MTLARERPGGADSGWPSPAGPWKPTVVASRWKAKREQAPSFGSSFPVPDKNVRISTVRAWLDSHHKKELAMSTRTVDVTTPGSSKEIAPALLRLGATSYGGPAIMGFMQAELQERRKWVSRER